MTVRGMNVGLTLVSGIELLAMSWGGDSRGFELARAITSASNVTEYANAVNAFGRHATLDDLSELRSADGPFSLFPAWFDAVDSARREQDDGNAGRAASARFLGFVEGRIRVIPRPGGRIASWRFGSATTVSSCNLQSTIE